MKLACCIVAAGEGTRLGEEWSDTPKALVPLLGRPMLYYSLNAFDNLVELGESGGVETFAIAVPPGKIEEFEDIVKVWGFSRPVTVVAGGATRSESVYNALKALGDDPPERVLIHDCARACVTPEMVKLLIESTPGEEAGTLAHLASDTLRMVVSGRIQDEIDRSAVACIETPQVFPYARILELHEQASKSEGDDVPTDDTTLFTRAGEKVHVVFHEGNNMKLTYPDDIGAAEGILFSRGWHDAGEEED